MVPKGFVPLHGFVGASRRLVLECSFGMEIVGLPIDDGVGLGRPISMDGWNRRHT